MHDCLSTWLSVSYLSVNLHVCQYVCLLLIMSFYCSVCLSVVLYVCWSVQFIGRTGCLSISFQSICQKYLTLEPLVQSLKFQGLNR